MHVHFESDDLHTHLARIRACRRELAEQLSSEISLIQGDPPRIHPQRLSKLVGELRWLTALLTHMENMEQALSESDVTSRVLLSVGPLNLDHHEGNR